MLNKNLQKEVDTKGIRWMAWGMAKESFIIKMEVGMKVSGRKTKWMDLVDCFINLIK